MKKIVLKHGREKSLLRRHPWVFSGAIKSSGDAQSGDIVEATSEAGQFLCYALWSTSSQIAARAISFVETDVVNVDFLMTRIRHAVALRSHLRKTTNAIRLIHGESDGVPGLVADQYADVVVLQLTTAGIEPHRDIIVETLQDATGAATIYERSDVDVRKLEGLAPRTGLLAGQPLAAETLVDENGLRIAVDIAHGHKTGFYIDQRDNRAVTKSIARDQDVLNCFCYTGTMSVAAVLGGAKSVLSIDSSGPALATAARNVALNVVDAIDPARAQWLEADVFEALRKFRDQGRSFDLIILDPPKLAPTIHHVEKAARAYKDINLLGFKLLRPGGVLMTYSCSGGVSAELFQKIVAGAAVDAKADAQVLRYLSAGEDHPVSVHFPESAYLKGLMIRRN